VCTSVHQMQLHDPTIRHPVYILHTPVMPSAVEHESGKNRKGDNEVEVPDEARFSQEEEAVSRRRDVLLKFPWF